MIERLDSRDVDKNKSMLNSRTERDEFPSNPPQRPTGLDDNVGRENKLDPRISDGHVSENMGAGRCFFFM